MKAYRTDIKTTLIENAEIIFAEMGYEGAGVRDIAAKAESNAALIYYHFESKEKLYKLIFLQKLSRLAEMLQQNELNPEWSSFQKLDSYIMVYVMSIKDNFYFHRMLNSELLSFRSHFFKSTILESISVSTAIFRKVIREGIEKKEFRAVDMDLFLMTLFHLLHQVIGKSAMASEILNLEEMHEEQIIERIKAYIWQQLYPAGH